MNTPASNKNLPSRDTIVAALRAERGVAQKGYGFEVMSVGWEDEFHVLSITAQKARRKLPIDDVLEGARVKWGIDLDHAGYVKFVDADYDRIIVKIVRGSPPAAGDAVWIFLSDFLSPLIDQWESEQGRIAIARYNQAIEQTEPIRPIEPLPAEFDDLRERQKLSVEATNYRSSIMIGPPGTGKTYTLGAMVAYLLTHWPAARILIVGPTNVAVDTVLISIDDWLQRLDDPALAARMKRIGAHFDPRKYENRPHLLDEGIAERANEFLILELSEPSKMKVVDYARWKDRMAAARKALGADIESVARKARVVAATVSTAIRWQDVLTLGQKWHFVICDEASQVLGPAAVMVGSLAQQTIFAGDPKQLAPIVIDGAATVQSVLSRTAFDLYAPVKTVRLNEQSRMSQAICHAVGQTFYGGDLIVCKKALRDPAWKEARTPYFVNAREVPRVCFEEVCEGAQYSQKYGGFIRFQSAKAVQEVADELSGSYVDPEEILVLTPNRAQRALIKSMLRTRHPRIAVSTVHRAQGSERTVVIFDPVDASSSFLSGIGGDRLLNVAISRAKAHVIIPFHKSDLLNPSLSKIKRLTDLFWQKSGRYAAPFRFTSFT